MDHLILIALIGADVLLLVAFIVLAIKHRRLRLFVLRISRSRQVKPDAAQIRDWQQKLKKYPEGTPKHTAYYNRLASIGALSKE